MIFDLPMVTWNPTTGCDRISPGCDHCYALEVAGRLKATGHAHYQTEGASRTSGPGFGLALHPDALEIPRGWERPRVVLVDTMSDLFHKGVPLSFLESVFAVMDATPQHRYLLLTKRARRLARLAGRLHWSSNVCMGVSVESDRYAFRADLLRTVPAAYRFLQLEPLIGPVSSLDLAGIDWVVAGPENGAGARPMDPAWLAEVERRCADAGVAFFSGRPGRRPLNNVVIRRPGRV